MNHVFIIGSKGIPAKYGGFETFVDNLIKQKKSTDIQYYVSCLSEKKKESDYYYDAIRLFVKVPEIGAAKAILYDILSLHKVCKYIEDKKIDNPQVYVLAARIGPFLPIFMSRIKKLGINLYLNPDGHEWKRSKWNWIVRKYWKLSEQMMVKRSQQIVCDSKGIEEYILKEYKASSPITKYIAYGADVVEFEFNDEQEYSQQTKLFLNRHNLEEENYYLVVGRFVPENNIELIINEFVKSNTNKNLLIITNITKNKFYDHLVRNTSLMSDKRICLVDAIYDQKLLYKIRQNAFAYIHGHSVGGTNPSLLEAMVVTKLNILFDVNFNREVGLNTCIYFDSEKNSLSKLINNEDSYSQVVRGKFGEMANQRIEQDFSWDKIIRDYEKFFQIDLAESKE